ncbi:very short patch repair endonuclease [Bowmanella denitrificans]|uniref:Very short patch repair endonuclease n=2 Tax=Bowmanella denitrificans TaxID=366582 RepID=A0ABP3HMT1_9ALTE
MAAIRNTSTQPELRLRKLLYSAGYRYRLNVTTLPGKPDIVLPKYKTVIFVHGCFWHAHECELFKWPSTRTHWWKTKLLSNRQRDMAVQDKLRELGWHVLIIWECRIESQQLLSDVSEFLIGNIPYKEIP